MTIDPNSANTSTTRVDGKSICKNCIYYSSYSNYGHCILNIIANVTDTYPVTCNRYSQGFTKQ